MTEELLRQLLKDKYGDFIPIRLTGGYTNQTYRLDGTDPPLVVKVASSSNVDIQNEINCLSITQKTGLVPKIYDLVDLKSHQLIVMDNRLGINGQSILDTNDFNKAVGLYKKLGECLAKGIHSLKYSDDSKGIRECNLRELHLDLNFMPEGLIHLSKEILSEISDQKQDWVLTHGDYGPHNVLYTKNNSLTVLDWEWSEWANPLTDLGWICWFTSLHYPEQADILISTFFGEYLTFNSINLSAKKLKAYSVYKVWKVLGKIEIAPIEVKQEWIKRLKWTIDTDIFHLPIFN